jgi:cytochrome oxidase Cu insertion factor (SCO1/SenC/PrrC family)
MQVQFAARRAGLSDQVEVVEVSVDPWRDSAARLRAYGRSTGVPFRPAPGWTVAQALDDLGRLLGRRMQEVPLP